MAVIRKAASDYTREIFHKLREREYNPELMRLYVVVGGGCCMIQNFGEYDKDRVTIACETSSTLRMVHKHRLLTHRKLHGILFLMKWELFKGKPVEKQRRKARRD